MDGVIIINKPKGFTSQDVVSKTKKILNVKKAGHTGTLDTLGLWTHWLQEFCLF